MSVQKQFDPKILKQFFLAGAAATYASGKKPVRPPERPWMKRLTWSDSVQFPSLTFVDEWFSSGEESAGSTLIIAEDDPAHPVWYMAYGGACKDGDKEVLAFHKRALLVNYAADIFEGGRGKDCYKEVGDRFLMYRSDFRGNFTEFHGAEVVEDETHAGLGWLPGPTVTIFPNRHSDVLFWHWFHGGLMERAKP